MQHPISSGWLELLVARSVILYPKVFYPIQKNSSTGTNQPSSATAPNPTTPSSATITDPLRITDPPYVVPSQLTVFARDLEIDNLLPEYDDNNTRIYTIKHFRS